MKRKDLKILLVEDNKADADLVKEFMEEMSLGVLSIVENGEDALLYLKQEGKFVDALTPDYVLLDLNLPKLDGREVLRAVKSDKKLRSIPIIVLTSSDAHNDITVAYGLNANCYVKKPSNFDDFMMVLETLNEFWTETVKLPIKEEKVS